MTSRSDNFGNSGDAEKLVAYWEALEGNLTAEEKAGLSKELEQSEGDRQLLNDLKSLRRDLAHVVRDDAPTPSEDLRDQVMRAAEPLLQELAESPVGRASSPASGSSEAVDEAVLEGPRAHSEESGRSKPARGISESSRKTPGSRSRRTPVRRAGATPVRRIGEPLGTTSGVFRLAAAVLVSAGLLTAGFFLWPSARERVLVATIHEASGRPGVRMAGSEGRVIEPADFRVEDVVGIGVGDVLFTRHESAAFFEFKDCGDLVMEPLTELEVLEAHDGESGRKCHAFRLLSGRIWATATSMCSLEVHVGSSVLSTHLGEFSVSISETGEVEVGHYEGEVSLKTDDREERPEPELDSAGNLMSWFSLLDSEEMLKAESEDGELRKCMIQRYDDRNGGIKQALHDIELADELAPAIERPKLFLVFRGEAPNWAESLLEDLDRLGQPGEEGRPADDLVFVRVDLDQIATDSSDSSERNQELEAWAERWDIQAPAFLVTCPWAMMRHGVVEEGDAESVDKLTQILEKACAFRTEKVTARGLDSEKDE